MSDIQSSTQATQSSSQATQNHLWRVRSVGNAEGVSYLLLLGVAMPLKYALGLAIAVKIAGWIHGALFVSLVAVTVYAWLARAITFGQAVGVAVMSLLPFGPFWMDRRLRPKTPTPPAE